jgi:hypothetical protein
MMMTTELVVMLGHESGIAGLPSAFVMFSYS